MVGLGMGSILVDPHVLTQSPFFVVGEWEEPPVGTGLRAGAVQFGQKEILVTISGPQFYFPSIVLSVLHLPSTCSLYRSWSLAAFGCHEYGCMRSAV